MDFSDLNFANMNDDVEIRPCRTHKELDQCVHLQKEIWGFDDLETVSRRTLVATNGIGGIIFGAFDSLSKESSLLGFAWCSPGLSAKTKSGNYLHTELLGVRQDARDRHIGQRLMLAARTHAVSQKIYLIMLNFDVLDSKLGHFYIHRLGGIGVQYKCNYYGNTSCPMQKNLPTDRIHVEFWLNSLHIEQRSKLIDELSSSGPDSIYEVHLPASINEWKRSGDPRAIEVLNDVRTKLTQAFEQNLAIVDFALKPDGSGTYKLGRYPSQKLLTGKLRNSTPA